MWVSIFDNVDIGIPKTVITITVTILFFEMLGNVLTETDSIIEYTPIQEDGGCTSRRRERGYGC